MSISSRIRLIVGLGNPEEKYQATRHNAGFWFMDAAAEMEGTEFERQSRFKGEVSCFTFQDEKIWLLKPLVYMNESGQTLRAFTDFYKIPTREILVVHDEIDLPNGTARLKWAGGHGGHNGLRSVFAHLDSNFWRLRIGIGHPGRKEDVVDYVLDSPTAEEYAGIGMAIEQSLMMLGDLLRGEMEAAMKRLHTNS